MWTHRKVWHDDIFMKLIYTTKQRNMKFAKYFTPKINHYVVLTSAVLLYSCYSLVTISIKNYLLDYHYFTSNIHKDNYTIKIIYKNKMQPHKTKITVKEQKEQFNIMYSLTNNCSNEFLAMIWHVFSKRNFY